MWKWNAQDKCRERTIMHEREAESAAWGRQMGNAISRISRVPYRSIAECQLTNTTTGTYPLLNKSRTPFDRASVSSAAGRWIIKAARHIWSSFSRSPFDRPIVPHFNFFRKIEKGIHPRFLDIFFCARARGYGCARYRVAMCLCLCTRAGRKLKIDFERNSERYVEHVSNDTEISRLWNSFSAVPTSPDDSSECHSFDVGHGGRVYLDAEEKWNKRLSWIDILHRINIWIEQDSFFFSNWEFSTRCIRYIRRIM